ncbi:twin transmembrane helix small protein [Comamonas sp.]
MDRMSYALALFLLAILACLASAGFFMLRKSDAQNDAERSKKMARALTLRIALSVVLFVCLLLAWKLGYIQPTGLPVGR